MNNNNETEDFLSNLGLLLLMVILIVILYFVGLYAKGIDKNALDSSPFETVQEQANIKTKNGNIYGSIVKDKETGKEYIIIHQFLTDKIIPRE